MARKTKSRRRSTRGRASAPVAKSRRSTRRRSGGRRTAAGFATKDILFTGAGAAVGLAAGPVLRKVVPASLAVNPYVLPAAKVVAGMLAIRYLRKFHPALVTGLGAGLIGSGALDVINVSRISSGKTTLGDYYPAAAADLRGYGDPSAAVVSPAMLSAPDQLVTLPDGSTVEGYTLGDGEVIDADGNTLAYAPVSGYTNG